MLLAQVRNLASGQGIGLISRTLPWPELVNQALVVDGGFCNVLWECRGKPLEFTAQTRFPLMGVGQGKLRSIEVGGAVKVKWDDDASMLLPVGASMTALASNPWYPGASIAMPENWYSKSAESGAEVVPCTVMHQRIRELAQLAALLEDLTGHEWEYLRIRGR